MTFAYGTSINTVKSLIFTKLRDRNFTRSSIDKILAEIDAAPHYDAQLEVARKYIQVATKENAHGSTP